MDLLGLNKKFENLSSEERIKLSSDIFGENLILSTSFGKYSAVMLHMTNKIIPSIPILFVDVGLGNKNYQFKQNLTDLLDLNVYTFPIQNGIDKIEAFENGINQLNAKAWLSGVMHHETFYRKNFSFVMQRKDMIYRIYPILDWNEKNCQDYLKKHKLPTNNFYKDCIKEKDPYKECGIHLSKLNT